VQHAVPEDSTLPIDPGTGMKVIGAKKAVKAADVVAGQSKTADLGELTAHVCADVIDLEWLWRRRALALSRIQEQATSRRLVRHASESILAPT